MQSFRTALASACVAVAFLTVPLASPLGAQEFGPQPDASTRAEILALREKAWRTFFANDQEGFKSVVPAELVALGWGGGEWEDRAQTLRAMGEFAKGGGRLETLEFPRNVMQQYGDAIILYTAFRIVLRAPDGTTSETRGRGTEIFARRNGKWIHTGWHLDTVSD